MTSTARSRSSLGHWASLQPPEAEFERFVRTLQAERRLPSVNAAVFRGGEPLWQLAVGLADVERDIPATPDTQYRIASITKTFTAAAILQLRDAGEVDIGAPLAEYVPELPDRRATIKDVLSHASGLQREEPGSEWDPISFLPREEMMARLSEVERVLEPREEWHYSNIGFALLGEVVARVSGRPYEDYVEECLFRPAGLERTTWEPEGAAVGYHCEPWTDVVHVEQPPDLGGGRPSGQLWSTTGDLARWAGFLRDPDAEVLRHETAAEMARVQTMADHRSWRMAWGLGLMLIRSDELVFAGHSGGMNGFASNLAWHTRGDTGAALLVNATGAQFSIENAGIGLAVKAAELAGGQPQAWRPGAAPPPELESVLGNWWTEGWEFVFSFRDGNLQARPVGSVLDPAVFELEQPDRYRTVSGRERGELLEIFRDDGGRAVKLTWATYPLTRTSLPMS